jgi:phosphatidate cytidylyltransferase
VAGTIPSFASCSPYAIRFADTGAYFAGRFTGPAWPKKLYEPVSPKKTVIGGIGGLLASFGAAIALGQMGDLCESMLKRSSASRTRAASLPGHGGMLDRVDALLFTAPYIYFYARWAYGRF